MKAFLVSRSKPLCVLVLILSTAAWFGASFYYLEMLTPFRPHYMGVAMFCMLVFFWARRWKWTVMAVTVVGLNLISILPAYLPTEPGSGSTSSLRIISANVNVDNDQYAEFIGWVRRQNPDIIIVQEVSPAWAREMEALVTDYPHHVQIPRSDNFGISAFSRLPLDKQKTLFLGSAKVPSLLLGVKVGIRKLSILATHPVPPINEAFFAQRNEQLDAVAMYMARIEGARMLIGDLNISTWSPYFTALSNRSGLKNASDGFGILPTWPTALPGLMIPLDHCLVSRDMLVRDFRTGEDTGSDHLPLFIHTSF